MKPYSLALVATAILTLTCATTHGAGTDTENAIAAAKLGGDRLVWVGKTNPAATDSAALLEALKAYQTGPGQDRALAFEAYLEKNPDSAWAPSLRANLALNYRQAGRYSKALPHWAKAWLAVKSEPAGNGKRVGDFILVHWTQLLSSLGRMDQLDLIMTETEGRVLDNLDWQPDFNNIRYNARQMRSSPGYSFRCGTYALNEVAKVLKATNAAIHDLREMPSPETGFSMAALAKLSDELQIGLVAARRLEGQEIIVPSVVHWRQNHYAAIIAKEGNRYKVVDPTFGRPTYLLGNVINEEASGYFMVPRQALPQGWQTADVGEQNHIFGKGLSSTDPTSPPPCPDEGQEPCECKGPGGGGAGGSPPWGGQKGPGCKPCASPPIYAAANVGMPTWEITDPYMSTWLHDRPMLYKTSTGVDVSLRMTYHSDERRPNDTNIFNFGPYWNCNWLSYVEITDFNYYPQFDPPDPLFTNYSAVVYGAAGGQREYHYYGSSYGASLPHHGSFTTFERVTNSTTLLSVRIHYPNGSIWTYGMATPHPNSAGKKRFFLTHQLDPQGRTTTFNYSTNNWVVYLNTVVDLDGRTNTLNYNTNAAVPTQVTSVLSPNGHSVTFAYHTNRLLTNIVDALGLSSYLFYMSNSGTYILTNLTTPYGTTRFDYLNPAGAMYGTGGPDNINRAIRVYEPNGAEHLFMYRDATPTAPFSNGRQNGAGIPCLYTDVPNLPRCECNADISTGIVRNFNMYYRNSFYWGPKLVALLSTTNLTQLNQTDYSMSRLRNWLHGTVGDNLGAMTMEREASADGTTAGPKTWLGYFKTGGQCHESATNNSPNYIARVLPNGDLNYTYREYNHLGHVTLEKTTWSNGSSVDTRTNTFVYSADGIDLLRVYDHAGHLVQSNLFNSLHQIIATRNAVGDWTTNTYDGAGRLTGTRSPAGLTTTNLYDGNGFLVTTIDLQVSRTNTFTYTNGLLFTRTDERGLTTTNLWDVFQRLLSVSYPDGSYVSNRYDKLDLSAARDRLGNWTYFAYNSVRQRTAVTNSLGFATTYQYCTCGSLDSVTDPLTNVTRFYYDLAGRPIATVLPDGSWTTNRYDARGRVTNVIDSAGACVTNWYNNQGMLVASSNAFGRVQSLVYDIEDHLTNQVDASGISISSLYDDLGRLVRRAYADGSSELFSHSPRGLVAHTNQLGKVTHFGYDVSRRKTAETNANLEVTQFTFSPAGDLLTLSDGKSQVTTWAYDTEGRATNKTDAAGTLAFAYSYDPAGRLTNRWTPVKGGTKYKYDAVGNLTNVDYAASADIALRYDPLNRLTTMTDAIGTSTFGYDSLGELLFEDGPWNSDRVSYTHAHRQLTALSVEHPFGADWQQTFTHDIARRLQTTVSPAGSFTYTYAGGGRMVTNLALGNGASIENTFDTLARLTATRLRNGSGAELNAHSYVYDPAGRRTNTVRVDGSYVRYRYDEIGQLIGAFGSESNNSTRLHEQFGYVYDAAGNLNHRTNNALVQTFTVNNVNQLSNATRSGTLTVAGFTTATATNVAVNTLTATRYADNTFARDGFTLVSGTNTFTAVAQDDYGRTDTNTSSAYLPATNSFIYDLNGNLLTDGRRHFTYDDENQLTTAIVTNATRSVFAYDGKMRRRIRTEYAWFNSAWAQTDSVRYVYDGNLVIEERNADSIPLVTYTRGNDLSGSRQGAGGIGGLLARSDTLQSGPRTNAYYHCDGNGNVTALLDALQLLTAKYLYDPFGNVLAAAGPLAEANLYRFSSKEAHEQSGLVYYLYRFYEPQMQRWVNRDPIEELGGFNLYAFLGNATVNAYDPFGMFKSPPYVDKLLQSLLIYLTGLTYKSCPKGACGDLQSCQNCCNKVQAVALIGILALKAAWLAGCVAATGGLGTVLCVVAAQTGGVIAMASNATAFQKCLASCQPPGTAGAK